MKTYYARHTDIALSDYDVRALCETDRIAVHYPQAIGRPLADHPDSQSIDPGDYRGRAKGTLRALGELAKDGGYVVAHYRGVKDLVIGRVATGSSISLEQRCWCSDSAYPGREAWIKTLAYERVGVVPALQQRRVLAFAPRQSTLCVWHKVGDRVERWAEGRDVIGDLAALTSDEQEVMCAEFLRDHALHGVPKLATLLMPVGRTMRGIDILGIAEDGRPVYAQVKFDDKEHYLSELRKLCEDVDAHVVLFSGIARSDLGGPVLRISLGEVFQHFQATRRGAQWLQHIFTSI